MRSMTRTTRDIASLGALTTSRARREALTPQLEQDLLRRRLAGDRTAASRLAEGCLPVVRAIAHRYRAFGVPVEDLVQEGSLGLLRAFDRFEPSHGVRCATYAAYWIKAAIREYIVRHYRIVRLGFTKGEQRALWLYRRTREAEPDELAAMAGMSPDRTAAILPLLMANDVSLGPASDADTQSFADRLADHACSAEDAVGDVEQQTWLRRAMARAVSTLPGREQELVERRLLAEAPMTLEALGVAWNVSKERARQIEEQAKARLRAQLEEVAAEIIPGARPPRLERSPRRIAGR
jgi:RNA polymerase sigma-32 factor